MVDRQDLDLKSILDVANWEDLQDKLAQYTGTAIITVDYKGIPVTRHSGRSEFCTCVREDTMYRKRCMRCDALASIESVRSGKPYIYLCHAGVVDVAVPIIVAQSYLGAVMFGQIRIKEGASKVQLNKLSDEQSVEQLSDTLTEEMKEKYARLPEMEYEKILHTAEFIESLVNYIVNRAVTGHNERLKYEWLLRNGKSEPEEAELEADGVLLQISDPHNLLPIDLEKTSPVYPAIEYVEGHLSDMIAMADMANLCHLSSSYFSKLFQHETGYNFKEYLNRMKIEAAKIQLRKSAASVGNIALSLGYIDTSYFVKVFKQYVGITPSVFRQRP